MNDTIIPLSNGDFQVVKYGKEVLLSKHDKGFTVCTDKQCTFYNWQGKKIAKMALTRLTLSTYP